MTFAFFLSSGNSPDPQHHSATEAASGEGRARGAKAAPAEQRGHHSPPLPHLAFLLKVIPEKIFLFAGSMTAPCERQPGEPPPLQTVASVWSYCYFLVAAGSPFKYLCNPLRDLTSPFLSSFFLFLKQLAWLKPSAIHQLIQAAAVN